MIGEIGTLNQGNQIGGFYDWVISLNIYTTHGPDGRVYHISSIKATASKYFYLKEPSGDEIIANYYQLIKDKLILMASHKVTLIKGEMIWMN